MRERMLRAVAEPDRVPEVRGSVGKWELTATPMGVADDGIYRVKHHGQVVVAIPGRRLLADCPTYSRTPKRVRRRRRRSGGEPGGPVADLAGALRALRAPSEHCAQTLRIRAIRRDGPGRDRSTAWFGRARSPRAGDYLRTRDVH